MKNKEGISFKNKFYWLFLIGFFLILALPLLNLPPWFSPPDWGKTIVFRIVLSILIFIFLWQILNSGEPFSIKFAGKVKIGLYLLLALLGIFFLATIFSLDKNFSLWGSPYRSGGFVNFAFYIFFAILALLILEESDWQKIWDFSIFIGIFVSIIAILQQFGILKKIFIPYEARPPSTISNPIFLAIYLLLLSFLTLSFALKEKKILKKSFYFFTLFLFLFVILLTGSRAAYLGFVVGFLFFLFFYPKKMFLLKAGAAFLLLLIVGAIFFVNIYSPLPNFIQENKTLSNIASRFFLKGVVEQERYSSWKISLQALKSRPLFGYGPENFGIGFEEHFDPTLPYLYKAASWWDRAHNFIFDISISAGIFALIIYLALLGVLFWQLQKLKNQHKSAEISADQRFIIYHGIQATFLAYLIANFFSFDSFSSYLISFLLISYSFYLISKIQQKPENKKFQGSGLWKLRKYKGPILFLLFILLVWFIWNFNIKSLKINAQINRASSLVKNERCDLALEKMEEILPQRSFLDSFLRLRYIESLERCESKISRETLEFTKKKISLLKEQVEIQPYYTRSWISLGSFTNVLIESEENPENIEKLKKEANYYFGKANQLSPKRQEVFIEWIITDLLTGEYQKAKEKAKKCIDVNEKLGDCWWQMALSNIYLREYEKAKENIKIAEEKGYPINSEISLLELIRAYKEVGNFEEAKKEALKILELWPEYEESVKSFLKELP